MSPLFGDCHPTLPLGSVLVPDPGFLLVCLTRRKDPAGQFFPSRPVRKLPVVQAPAVSFLLLPLNHSLSPVHI